mmetsp:Transcript_24110/g.51975  ORF Transcript_24110/g.51975 Transcript_24110/m.51975 type:complete len:101 (-) Transcript_24110:225-527(-)
MCEAVANFEALCSAYQHTEHARHFDEPCDVCCAGRGSACALARVPQPPSSTMPRSGAMQTAGHARRRKGVSGTDMSLRPGRKAGLAARKAKTKLPPGSSS